MVIGLSGVHIQGRIGLVIPTKYRVLLKAGPWPSGPPQPIGPAARRPSGPRPTAREGSPDFPQFVCPAVNPRACTDLHQVSACKMDDGEFEFVTILII